MKYFNTFKATEFLRFIKFYLFIPMNVLPAYVPGVHRGQKKASDPMKLEI